MCIYLEYNIFGFLEYILSKYLASMMLSFNFSNGNMLFRSRILLLHTYMLILNSVQREHASKNVANFLLFFPFRKYIERLYLCCHYKNTLPTCFSIVTAPKHAELQKTEQSKSHFFGNSINLEKLLMLVKIPAGKNREQCWVKQVCEVVVYTVGGQNG